MIVNKSSVAAFDVAFKKIFTDALQGASDSRMVARFANRFPNTAAALDMSWIGTIPGMRKLVGTAEQENVKLVNWVIENEEWHDTVAVKLKDVERDQLGLYNELFKLLADAGGRHPDELLAQAMLAGFTAKDYTGKNFFDTAKKHFPSGKATFDNKLTVELHPKTFEAARVMLRTMKVVFPGDKGNVTLPLGRDMVLIVGPANESLARTILTAETVNATTNVNRGTAKLEVWNEIGDGAQWFLMDEGFGVKPFAFSDERPTSIESVTDLSDSYVLKHKEFLYQAYGRYNVGYGMPQLIIGSTGADAYSED